MSQQGWYDAFNPSYCHPSKSVKDQLREGIDFLKHRYRKPVAYLAYFQAYSNTYAPLSRLELLYKEALDFPGIAGLIIGTRPDCIDDQKLDYFQDLSKRYFIALEYGIESCYEKTLIRINRGHSYKQAVEALEKTSARGIKTGAHFIFGLPGESIEEMLDESGIISRLPLATVKFHQLQILKGTPMESEFREKPHDFIQFELNDYVEFFIRFLERFNPDIVVERFTGEALPSLLSENRWGGKRTEEIMGIIEERLEKLDTWQGKYYNKK
jgi:radical SAM protein (TIGR01212 family)